MAKLGEQQIEERLAALPGWRREAAQEIVGEREFEDFAGALAYVNRVGELAEQANHHPDILLHGWNKVRLTLSTHSEGGLTAADFDRAQRVQALS
jgi:4a-hydroxytetrahydrobiopterin dehydratase